MSLDTVQLNELLKQYYALREENIDLKEKNSALIQEIRQRNESKPFNIGVVVEDYVEEKYGRLIRNMFEKPNQKEGESIRPLPYIRVTDPNGGELVAAVHESVQPEELKSGQTVYIDQDTIIRGTDGYYKKGLTLPLERILPDGRLILRGESGSDETICEPCPYLDVDSLNPGDRIRIVGHLALENLGQAFKTDDLVSIPLSKDLSDMVGTDWKDIYRDYKESLYDMEKSLQDASHDGDPFITMLLHGLNGNGKTTGARALIWDFCTRYGIEDKECLIVVKGGELISKYVGETESNIRNVFSRLRKIAADHDRACLFIDEFDAISNSSSIDVQSSWVGTSVVPTLKAELDGPVPLEKVFIVCTLNNKVNIDPPLLRRFNNQQVVRCEKDCIPNLVDKIFDRWKDYRGISPEKAKAVLINTLNTIPLGQLQSSNKKHRDFYPIDITSYADCEEILIKARRAANSENRELDASDITDKVYRQFIEKARGIRVGVQNGYRLSNARDYFATLDDSQFVTLERVILYDENDSRVKKAITVSHDMESI